MGIISVGLGADTAKRLQYCLFTKTYIHTAQCLNRSSTSYGDWSEQTWA